MFVVLSLSETKIETRERNAYQPLNFLFVITVLSFKFSEQSLCKRSKKYSTDIFP